jgi:hypothetical protein
MQVRKYEIATRRLNQRIFLFNDFPILHDHYPKGAGAVAAEVRGFEVNGREPVEWDMRRFFRLFWLCRMRGFF